MYVHVHVEQRLKGVVYVHYVYMYMVSKLPVGLGKLLLIIVY